jgi:pimeloyl-ACP methyl ester carboxylesterase
VTLPSSYDPAGYVLTRNLFEDGRNHLVMRDTIDLRCPVRLIHGMRDPDVPWRLSLAVAELVASADVVVTLVKEGDHRLSTEPDLERLRRTLAELL